MYVFKSSYLENCPLMSTVIGNCVQLTSYRCLAGLAKKLKEYKGRH